MKKTVLFCLLSLFPGTSSLFAASFSAGNLVVLRVGDGATALSNSQGPVSLIEFNSAGTTQQAVNVSTNSTNGLQVSGTATSEGQLGRSSDGSSLVVAGYVPPFTGSGSLSGRTAAAAPRGFVTVGSNGAVSSTTTLTGSYSGQNIRDGITVGSTSYFSGSSAAGAGLVAFNGTTATQIQNVNTRVLQATNGDLYYSTGSGTQGIYKYSGVPTASASAAAFLTGVTGQGTNPYDFVLNDAGTTLYVADSDIGVQKFTYDGSAWSLAYNLTGALSGATRAFGLAVDFSSIDPVVYWTSPTDVYKATDQGVATTGTSILSAGTNYAFRGLEFAPVPEPSAMLLGSIGLLGLLRRRR